MSKQHYFVIFAERNGMGKVKWKIDNAAFSATHKPVYNTKTGEWESIYENEKEDDLISEELVEKLNAECVAGEMNKK